MHSYNTTDPITNPHHLFDFLSNAEATLYSHRATFSPRLHKHRQHDNQDNLGRGLDSSILQGAEGS